MAVSRAINDWMRDGRFSHDAPILTPQINSYPPAGCFLRAGSATPQDLFDALNDLGGEKPGLCPRDFGFDRREVLEVFGENVVI